MKLPLRFELRYDPLFLEFERVLRSGLWGKLRGVMISAIVHKSEDEREILAFISLLFGPPSSIQRTVSFPLSRSLFMFDSSFALSLELSVVPEIPLYGQCAILSISSHASRALVEARLGSDRLLAYSPDEDKQIRMAFAEGDAERYLRMDREDPRGPQVVQVIDDDSACSFADKVLQTGMYP